MSTIQDKLIKIKNHIGLIRDEINKKYPSDVLKEDDSLANYPYFIENLQTNVDIAGLSLSKNSESVAYNKQFETFSIITEGAWIIDEVPEWITCDKMSGYGNHEMTLTIDVNKTFEKRNGVVSVVLPYYADATQNPKQIFVLTQDCPKFDDYSVGEYAVMSDKLTYNTGVIPTKDTKVVFKFNFKGNNKAFNGVLFGSTSTNAASANAFYTYFAVTTGTSGNTIKSSFAGCVDDLAGSRQDKNRSFLKANVTLMNATITMDSNKSTFVADGLDEVVLNDFSVEVDGTPARDYWVDAVTPISLFSRGYMNGTSIDYNNVVPLTETIEFINCKIYEGEELIRDYVPLFDLEYNPCLFDKVNNTFLYNIKTNTIKGYLIPKQCTDSSYITMDKDYIYCINNVSDSFGINGGNVHVTSSEWITATLSEDGNSVNYTIANGDEGEYREGFITIGNGTTEKTCTIIHITNTQCTLLDSIVFRGSTRETVGCNSEYATFVDTGVTFSSDYNLVLYYKWLSNEDYNRNVGEVDICGSRHSELSDGELGFDPRRTKVIISDGDSNFICFKVGTATNFVETKPPYNMKFQYISKKLKQNESEWFNINLKDNFMKCDRTFYLGGLHITDDKDNIKRTMAGGRWALKRCVITDENSTFLRMFLPVLVNNDEVTNKPALLDAINNKIYFNEGQPMSADGITPMDFGYITLDGQEVNIGTNGENLPYKLRFEAKTNTDAKVEIIEVNGSTAKTLFSGTGSTEFVTSTPYRCKVRVTIGSTTKDCYFPVSNYLYELNGSFYDINDNKK